MLRRLASLRGQLVLWYLAILVLLLVGVGIFQSFTLGRYLQTTTGEGLRDAARTEMAVLGPCYIRSPSDLYGQAQRLALLLGSREIAVKIVTPSGATLADHGFGDPGRSQPLELSATTIRSLIAVSRPRNSPPLSGGSTCRRSVAGGGSPQPHHHHFVVNANPTLSSGNFLLTAVPLGPSDHIAGYAIVGRSMSQANATIRETRLVSALGALLALIVAALIALPIINRALGPLRHMSTTAAAIAGGDMERRANLRVSADEIGQLGEAFDTMVDRLQAALAAAQESEENMRRFLADASHELRTPITALSGTSEVLLRRGESGQPEVDHGLRAMHIEALRLSRLVDDLLTLSRLDSGQSLNPQPVELHQFLEGFVERYAGVWAERTISLDDLTERGSVVIVDAEALTRVLTNLVDNAAKYSHREGEIMITAATEDGEVTIAVRDEGPGLSREDAAHVFDRFYRASKSRSRQSGGTGLGLAIVHALVQQSGGEVRIETGREIGTTVAFTVPQVAARVPAAI